jgi:hypothetical protein
VGIELVAIRVGSQLVLLIRRVLTIHSDKIRKKTPLIPVRGEAEMGVAISHPRNLEVEMG